MLKRRKHVTRTDDVPVSWDERTVLTTMLDYTRDTVHAKCAGITEENARRAFLPTSPLMTIAGLVSHLRWVEYSWIEVDLLGEPDMRGPATDERDGSWRIRGVPLAELLAGYQATCARNRELVAALDLDTPSKGELSWRAEPVTLRWVLFHLVEETARHNGHIDILREMADGVTGM
jgi:uncharacterized damage-inducible protein DinB